MVEYIGEAGGGQAAQAPLRRAVAAGTSGANTFVNRNILSDIAGSGGSSMYVANMMVNFGMTVTYGAIFSRYASADITSSGTIENRADIAIRFGFDGRMVNETSAVVYGLETTIWGLCGEVINRGKI